MRDVSHVSMRPYRPEQIEAVTALQKSSAMDPTILTYLKSSVAEAEMSKRRSLTRITTIDLCASNHVGLSLGNHPLGLLCIDVTPEETAHKAGLRPGGGGESDGIGGASGGERGGTRTPSGRDDKERRE